MKQIKETQEQHKPDFIVACFVQDEGDKVIICERGDLVFVFNFNPSQSFTDYKVGCKNSGSYKVASTHFKGFACAHNIAACRNTLFCTYTEHRAVSMHTSLCFNSHALYKQMVQPATPGTRLHGCVDLHIWLVSSGLPCFASAYVFTGTSCMPALLSASD